VDGQTCLVGLSDGSEVRAPTVLLACGASYRRLEAPGVDRLVGRGVHYGAAVTDAQSAAGGDIIIVGGANSAGQAALHFARYARLVTVLVRSGSLEKRMSRYLVDRITAAPNIKIRTRAEVSSVTGEIRLRSVDVRDAATGEIEPVRAQGLFIFIGAVPHADWLGASVARDSNGFVLSGRDVVGDGVSPSWPLERDPYLLETSVPGIFACGDVRYGPVKRVAAAVGEGSMAIALVHQYLRNAETVLEPSPAS
jgi:thioredoxin reductase (NADPH)